MRVRLVVALCAGTLAGAIVPARAVDHDNIDANRPLDFDDAETISFGERSLDVGAALADPRGGKIGVAGEAEFLYGFARNWHLNVGVDPSFSARSGNGRQFSAGDLSLGVQHNFNRETVSSPAFGFRADAVLPTGRGSRGTDLRLRAIASRKYGRYGRLHLNADVNINNSPRAGERRTLPGLILGYSQPLGYPRRFDRTLVAQLAVRAAPTNGNSALVNVGVGIRQQVTPRSVFDVGLKSDIAGGGGDRENFRLIAGYSSAF